MNDISHYFFLLSIYKRDETIDDIIKLAKELILFKPTRFFPNRRGIKRLNKESFFDFWTEELNASKRLYFQIGGKVPQPYYGNLELSLLYFPTTDIIQIHFSITETERDILKETEKIVRSFAEKHTIIVSALRNLNEWKYNDDTNIKHISELHPEINEMKTVGTKPVERPDPEQFPAHTHNIDGIWFGCCYEMWFGSDYDKYIPLEKLRSFNQCKLNETLENGTVHIVLYDSPDDFASEKSVANAWALRKHTECDKEADFWEAQVRELSKGLGQQVYEIEEGKFPHGGIRLIKTYLDENGKHVPKHEAVKVHISEREHDGKAVFEKTVELNKI